ncbi:hypothetical protein D3C87_1691430 [compost metagenome]
MQASLLSDNGPSNIIQDHQPLLPVFHAGIIEAAAELSRDQEHTGSQPFDLDLPLPFQLADLLLAAPGVHLVERHDLQVLRELLEQSCLLLPRKRVGRAPGFLAQHFDHRHHGQPRLPVVVAPLSRGDI